MAKHVGLFIPLPERLARQYPPEGRAGEDESPAHLTLLYIGDVEDDRLDELRDVLSRVLPAIPPLELRLLPPTSFKNDSGQTIVHNPVEGPLLHAVHDALDKALKRRGFDVQGYDKFRPHVTIEYVDPGEQPKFDYVRPSGRWVADSVGLWVEEDRRSIPLGQHKVHATTVWYHGSHQAFDQFKRDKWLAFDRKTVDRPVWLTSSYSFARLHAGAKGCIYTVEYRPRKTFPETDLLEMRGRFLQPTKLGTVVEQALYDGSIDLGIGPEEDALDTLKAMNRLDYDVMETAAVINWARRNRYDSIWVRGDGPRNLLVLDPREIKIVSRECSAQASLTNPGVDDAAIIVAQKYAGAYSRFLSRGGQGALPSLSRILAAEHKRWQKEQRVGTRFNLDELTRAYISLQTSVVERAHDREGAAMSVGLTTLNKQPYRTLVEKLIGRTTARREIIAELLSVGRHDLANVVAYGAQDTPSDLLKSLRSLAKYNDGLWKSEKQGKFLWSWAAGTVIDKTNDALAWARTTGWYDPSDKKQLALQFILLDERFGRRDRTKIRYNGAFVLIDGTGVLATASFKVQHPKQDDEDAVLTPVPNSATTQFVRDRSVVPPINVDPAGDAARERAKQLKQNEPTIKAIESIPGWQDQQIFRDFHGILQAGGTLSPGQMRVIERNVPMPIIDVPPVDQLVRKMNEMDGWIERVFMPAYIKALGRAGDSNQEIVPRIKQELADYKTGKTKTIQGYEHNELFHQVGAFIIEALKFNLYRHLKGARGVTAWDGYPGFRDQLNKAIPKLKRGKPPSKTEMIWIRVMLALHDKIVTTPAARVAKYYS